MEKNRIIVTGLSLFKDTLQEQCIACDYDFEWVFTYPSTLLWADEIILSPSIMDIGQRALIQHGH